jgi:hypothetical protein
MTRTGGSKMLILTGSFMHNIIAEQQGFLSICCIMAKEQKGDVILKTTSPMMLFEGIIV